MIPKWYAGVSICYGWGPDTNLILRHQVNIMRRHENLACKGIVQRVGFQI